MEDILCELGQRFLGQRPDKVVLLPASGSARKYYRMYAKGKTWMGTWNPDIRENELFIDFTHHFETKGLRVPAIYAVSDNHLAYLQEDLGDQMLLQVIEKERTENRLNTHLISLYKKALSELLRFQIVGNEGLDYSRCIPRPVFDERCIHWDLNYFKYCFLRLAGASFSEEALENDFETLTRRLGQVGPRFFMFRDFQSRNIMVRDEEVWFIDYQGGRQGALQYDVASLLYDAIAAIPDEQREELLEYYIDGLQQYGSWPAAEFCRDYYHFVLVRLLQAMGAFGLRGLYERKQHFLDSIRLGLAELVSLFDSGKLDFNYPEIHRVIHQLRQRDL